MNKSIILLVSAILFSGCGGGGNSNEPVNSSSSSSSISSSSNSSSSSSSVSSDEITMTGKELYDQHCAVCHKEDGTGLVGPNIIGSRAADIAEALETQDDMAHLVDIIKEPEQALIEEHLQLLKEQAVANDPNIVEQKVALGRSLFFDHNLSLNKTMSCSTCHDPNHAFVDARHLDTDTTNPVQGALSVGDDDMTLGGRNAPTAAYAQFAPNFIKLEDGTYMGGMFHDGRAKNLQEQAKGPFLDPAEMMMPDSSAVVTRVQENAEYVTQMKTLYGSDIFSDTENAYDAIAESIAKFEKTEAFATFDSKYDRSKLAQSDPDYYQMSALEQEGYTLFFDKSKTNCALCHTLNSTTEATTKELFTNYKYENTGTPKNIEALLSRDGNSDKTDLGLGGRSDINDGIEFGKFKVPTLRNIAITAPYMSNGVFKELKTVIEFYDHIAGNEAKAINPETGKAWGEPEVSETINHTLLDQLQPLSERDVLALEAFMKLLTDKRYEHLLVK